MIWLGALVLAIWLFLAFGRGGFWRCRDRVFDLDFKVGAFTNLTQDHLDFHRTLDAYREAKMWLFTALAGSALAFSFLLAWESMALLSAFLVVGLRPTRAIVSAGNLYLGLTHVATAAILVSFRDLIAQV